MKTVVNLVDDYRPGGIRSLLEDMTSAAPWQRMDWRIQLVDSSAPIRLCVAPDVIVVHYSMAWRKLPWLMQLRRRYRHAKLIIVEHHYTKTFEQHSVGNQWRFRYLLKKAYGLADEVIAVSQAQASWLSSAGTVAANRLKVIPSCRDYSRFLAIPRVDRGNGPIEIGAMGRLTHAKGFDLLIRAMRDLPAERYRLRLAGDGEQREHLQSLAEGMENVELLGHLDDTVEFLATCDLLVMPSRTEAFGLVCAEAKAAGLPVVVTNVDALPMQAADCGVVVEPDDVAGLVGGIEHVTNPRRSRRFREHARMSVANAWSQYLNAWSAVLA